MVKKSIKIVTGALLLFGMLLAGDIEVKAYEAFEDSQGVEYTIENVDDDYCSAYVSEIDNLSIITIPEQVTYDGNSYTVNEVSLSGTDSTSLTQINIPSTVVDFSCNLNPQSCPNLDRINVDEANSVYCSDENGWVYSKDKTVLYFVSLASEHIVIPDGVNKLELDFEGSQQLISIEMPDSVEELGSKIYWDEGCYTYSTNPTFYNCTNLTRVKLSESLTEIRGSTFYGCTSLKEINMPLKLTSIEDQAFGNCLSLENVVLPESLKKIGREAFEKCISLESLTVPIGLETADHSFVDSGIKTVTFQEGMKVIPAGMFSSCIALNQIEFSDTIVEIGSGAFAYCDGLKNVTIPSNIVEGGYAAFLDSGLQTVIFEEGTVKVSEYMFWRCSSLKNVSLSETITEIEQGAFRECFSLENITIPRSVKKIGVSVFGNSDSDEEYTLTIHGYTGSCAEKIAKDNEFNFVSIGSVVGEEGGNTEATDNRQASTEQSDTKEPTTEQSVTISKLPTVGTRETISGVEYKVTKSATDSKEVTFVKPKSNNKTSITIPATVKIDGYTYKVTEIASKAFKNNKKLKSVTIGKNVKKIGNEAFSGCKNLKKVTIGKKVTTIGKKSFYNCKKLKTITIKSTVLKSVGKNAVKNIDKKATIKVPKSKLKKYKSLFKSKTGYKKTMKIKK